MDVVEAAAILSQCQQWCKYGKEQGVGGLEEGEDLTRPERVHVQSSRGA